MGTFARPSRHRKGSKMSRHSTVRVGRSTRSGTGGRRLSGQGLLGNMEPLDQLQPLQQGSDRRTSVPSLGAKLSSFTNLSRGGSSNKSMAKSMTVRGGNPYGGRSQRIPDLDRMQSSGPRIIQAA